jgi:hypothetical protein
MHSVTDSVFFIELFSSIYLTTLYQIVLRNVKQHMPRVRNF